MKTVAFSVRAFFALMLVGGFFAMAGVSQANAAGYGRITLHVNECQAYTGDLFNSCHDNRLQGVRFYISGALKTTDANGITSGAPSAGHRSVRINSNDLAQYDGSYVYCSNQTTGAVLYDGPASKTIYVNTTAGQEVVCDWYLLYN